MSSRIIVKNLPKHISEKRIREIFGLKGTITDVKLLFRDGVFRRFCYIGYKSEQEASEAVQYFNNTFVDTSRIIVESAHSIGSNSLERPWSKYSEGSSRYGQVLENTNLNTPIDKQQETDPKLKEFLNVLDGKGKIWGNDDVAPTAQVPDTQDTEYQDLINPVENTLEPETHGLPKDEKSIAFDDQISDMDYLRSKKIEPAPEELVTIHPSRLAVLQNEGVVDNVINQYKDTQDTQQQPEVKNFSDVEEPIDSQVPPAELIADTGRLLIRNLPYSCTMEDLEAYFKPFGNIVETHIPISKETKSSRGYGFVLFVMPQDAVKAYMELDKSIFQGRIIEILPAREKPVPLEEQEVGPQSFKKSREKERKKKATNDFNWNSLFMNSDAVAEAMASKLGVKKADILDSSTDNMAVRLALAESSIINETKEYFKKQGVSLESFKNKARSNTVLIVKNISFKTEANDLLELFGKFGTIGRLVLPPTKTIAIIEIPEANEAKSAFRKLCYSKFKNLPLYLEWAPKDIFLSEYNPNQSYREEQNEQEKPAEPVKIKDSQDVDAEIVSTVFVKNLNFQTTDQGLLQAFASCNPRSCRIVRKLDPKTNQRLSMGFGFIEFTTKDDALKCIKTLQGLTLDGHELALKFSNSASSKTTKKRANWEEPEEEEEGTKLLIRNIPFEATKKDIKQLFSSFASVKTVRLPTKFDKTHRGFGFVDFTTHQEAKIAKDSLSATHLYGRHLVIEWAKEEQGIESLREKASKGFVKEKKQRVELDEPEY